MTFTCVFIVLMVLKLLSKLITTSSPAVVKLLRLKGIELCYTDDGPSGDEIEDVLAWLKGKSKKVS